jgi:hypothetical protein
MTHGDAREGKWRGNWQMKCVACTLHTTSEHVVSIITTADAHTSAAISRLNWRPSRFKWTRPFRRKTKSGFCACAITFQTQSTHTTIQIFCKSWSPRVPCDLVAGLNYRTVVYTDGLLRILSSRQLICPYECICLLKNLLRYLRIAPKGRDQGGTRQSQCT